MSNNFIIFLLALILIGLGVAVFFLIKKISSLEKKEDSEELLMLQQQLGQMTQLIEGRITETNRTLDKKLSEANRLTQDQLSGSSKFIQGVSKESRELLDQVSRQFNEMSRHSQKTIQEVTEKLTKLDETNKRVVDFSSQLKNLQDILKNPKQRGVLGEYFLEETLRNVLPPNSYKMQYEFQNGDIVDAAVFVKDKVIPVDSKFSLENYEQLLGCNDVEQRKIFEQQFKRDLKNRIDETAKYVRTDEDTMDFAFMFIPSESIYYDLLVSKVGAAQVSSRDLIDYAFKEKHVIIVSPTSFLAYLQTVLQGLRALVIEDSAKEIRKNVEKLAKHLQVYQSFQEKLGSNLTTVVNQYNSSVKEWHKIDKDVMKITGVDERLLGEGNEVEKPTIG